MFSGIVERMGEVVEIRTDRQNKDFTLRADFCKELKIDQSIAHNGVCLTVVDIRDDAYTVTAMKETLDKSNLGLLKTGDLVNLERSMKPDALLDGHIVQGGTSIRRPSAPPRKTPTAAGTSPSSTNRRAAVSAPWRKAR